MTESRNNQIAAKLRELADLFHGVADTAPLVVPGSTEPAADEPKKRGRPAKADAAPAKTEPADTSAVVTAGHPKRAELVAAAKAYAALTSMGDAQKAMKLFGESSKVVPDAELAGAIQHFINLVKKANPPAPAPADDESI